jgi:hypothetical protein
MKNDKKVVDFDLLCNMSRINRKPDIKRQDTDLYLKSGDNGAILHLIQERLKIGFSRYGHGVQIEQDTRVHGTKANDWLEMSLEESLDMAVYFCAEIIRHRRAKRMEYNNGLTNDDIIVDTYNRRYLRFLRN